MTLTVRHADEVYWWFRAGGFLPDTVEGSGPYVGLAEGTHRQVVDVRVDPGAPFPLTADQAAKAVLSLTVGIPSQTDGLGPAMLDRCLANLDEALRVHAAAGTDGRELAAMREAWADVRAKTAALDVEDVAPLSGEVRGRVLRELQPGRPAVEGLNAVVDQAPVILNPLVRVRQRDGRKLAWMVVTEPAEPAPRMALLGIMTTEGDLVLDRVVLEGEALFDQQQRLARAMGVKPQDAEARAKARVEQMFEVLRGQLQPGLAAAVREGPSGDRIHLLLRPRPGDAAKAFAGHLAPVVEQAVATLWDSRRPPRMTADPAQTEVELTFATVGALVAGLSVAGAFPQAYRALAPHLVDGRVWATWVYHRPGETRGMRYDGLVWLDDHWAWFPKPWRMVAHLLQAN